MNGLQLFGTPLSHFTRKIRVLLAEIGVDFEFVRVPGVLATTASGYGDNPLMRVPTLAHEGEILIESDHIARHLVRKFDAEDRLAVCRDRVDDLNRLAVANGIMGHEVSLILAKRGGLADLDGVVYFRKLALAIENGLAWLDAHVARDDEPFDYRDVVIISMWQHLVHYALVPELERHSRLAARVARFAARPSIASTTPEVSLQEAIAAGWKPG